MVAVLVDGAVGVEGHELDRGRDTAELGNVHHVANLGEVGGDVLTAAEGKKCVVFDQGVGEVEGCVEIAETGQNATEGGARGVLAAETQRRADERT